VSKGNRILNPSNLICRPKGDSIGCTTIGNFVMIPSQFLENEFDLAAIFDLCMRGSTAGLRQLMRLGLAAVVSNMLMTCNLKVRCCSVLCICTSIFSAVLLSKSIQDTLLERGFVCFRSGAQAFRNVVILLLAVVSASFRIDNSSSVKQLSKSAAWCRL
jgi:hypothetical protein